jgi:two-component system nitrate/nitrite response regulator NarL
MDLKMPAMDGVTLLKKIHAEVGPIPSVILTMSDGQDDLANVLRAGGRGYLLKDMEPTDIIEYLRRAAKGELVVAPAMSAKLSHFLQHGNQAEDARSKSGRLTEREREILRFIASGSSNKAIAKVLNISHDTVKLHVRHILAKLNLSTRVQAAVFAVENRNNTDVTAPRAR